MHIEQQDSALRIIGIEQELARRCGYPNAQSFARAFRTAYGMSPLQYRQHGNHVAFRAAQAGRAVPTRHRRPYATMRAAYQWLYGHWLVNSGHEVGDAPVFEEYLNNPRDTAPADLLTDICLPLARTTAAR